MPNYKQAINLASILLLQQTHIDNFPIKPQDIKIKNINNVFCTFSEYSKKTNVPISQLTNDGKFSDGYTLRNIRPNTNIILYNDKVFSSGRILWTNSHELGHIALNHTSHNLNNEKEANAFASQLLLPKCILKKLIKEHVPVTPKYLIDNFGLSEEAAQNSLSSIKNSIDYDFEDIYDEALLIKFSAFLSNKTSNFLCSYLDDIETERLSWE